MDHKIGSGARCAMIGYGSWATALAKVLAVPKSIASSCVSEKSPIVLCFPLSIL